MHAEVALREAPVLPFAEARPTCRRALTNSDRDPPPRDTASYIAAIVGELAGLAAGPRMEVLRYLLEMARDEARGIALDHTPDSDADLK